MHHPAEKADLKALPTPEIVFSDFDGTLTEHTEFSSKFLDILSLLAAQQIPLIIVTGRSLSWAHFLLTHFKQITHVIAEGGGVHAHKSPQGHIQQKILVDDGTVGRLEKITQALKIALPEVNFRQIPWVD